MWYPMGSKDVGQPPKRIDIPFGSPNVAEYHLQRFKPFPKVLQVEVELASAFAKVESQTERLVGLADAVPFKESAYVGQHAGIRLNGAEKRQREVLYRYSVGP